MLRLSRASDGQHVAGKLEDDSRLGRCRRFPHFLKVTYGGARPAAQLTRMPYYDVDGSVG